MVLLLVFMQLTRDLFAIAKFLLLYAIRNNLAVQSTAEAHHTRKFTKSLKNLFIAFVEKFSFYFSVKLRLRYSTFSELGD